MRRSITLRDSAVNTYRVRPASRRVNNAGMGFPANLRRLRTAAKLTQEQLAHACGWPGQSRVANYEAGKREPNLEEVALLAAALRVEPGDLLDDAPSAARVDREEWLDVQGFAQAIGLGAGAEAQEYAETHKLKFRAEALSGQGLKPRNLAVMYGDGDSMLPRVHDGDAILFDTGDTRPIDGALYVIQVHGAGAHEYQVKRALILDDVVYFAADNPNGDHSWRKPRKADTKRGHIEIIGRVRWIGSWEE